MCILEHKTKLTCDIVFAYFVDSQPPYLIGVLPKYVEVRTVEPRHLIQTIDLQKPRISTMWRYDCIVYKESNNFVLLVGSLSHTEPQLLKTYKKS